MTTPMPTIEDTPKRVVLLHTAGPYTGLYQITGTTAEFGGEKPPTFTDEFTLSPGARQGHAQLISVHPRHVLYREWSKPQGLGTFDARQR